MAVPVYERTQFYCFLHGDNGPCTGPLPASAPTLTHPANSCPLLTLRITDSASPPLSLS